MRKGNQTSFSLELEMRAPAEKWLRDQGLIIKREFALPWGICDLVGCSINKVHAKKRIKHGQKRPIGSSFRVLLLDGIPDYEEGGCITFEELYSSFKDVVSEDSIYQELCRLHQDKFITKSSNGTYQKINGWMPLHKRLVAVELKMDKVNEALHQAICNLEFADESYVGLPMDTAKKVFYGKKKLDFTKHGVGVLGLSKTNSRLFLKSTLNPNRINEIIQKYAVELFWHNYTINIAT